MKFLLKNKSSNAAKDNDSAATAEATSAKKKSHPKFPRTHAKPHGGYGPTSSIILTAFIFIFAQVILAAGIGLYIMLFVGEDPQSYLDSFELSTQQSFLLSLAFAVLQVLLLRWILRLRSKSFRDIGLVRPVAEDALRAVLSWGVYLVVFVVLVGVLQLSDSPVDFEQDQQLGFEATRDRVELLLVFISVVILPSISEELLIRGFLFKGLRSRLSFLKSALVTSGLFGALHLQFFSGEPLLWAAFVDTFVLSMVLCYVVDRYGSLWPAIGAHFIKNSLAFTFVFVIQL